MSSSGEVSAEALKEACESLARLAEVEYGETLDDLFARDEPVHGNEYQATEVHDSRDVVWRVGRLIGITVKEPFATARRRTENDTSQTGARRVWELNEKALRGEHPGWWQYRLIAGFLATEERTGYFDWLPPAEMPEAQQVAWFLEAAHSERGVFGALAKSARKYVCTNPELQAALGGDHPTAVAFEVHGSAGNEASTSRGSGRVKAEPPQVLFGGVTASAAGALVAAVPWLTPSMTPLIAGLLLVISAKGLDAFCSRAVPAPVTEIVET